MNYDEPTQRIRATRPAPTPMPGPLDLTGEPPAAEPPAAQHGVDRTEVLPLDELLGPPEEPQPVAAPSAAADAPTWTAMPVVAVRSEPVGAPAHRAPGMAPVAAAPAAAASATAPAGALSDRVLDDARKAWTATMRRSRAWVGVQDNAIMLATAAVAILLIIVVALLGQ